MGRERQESRKRGKEKDEEEGRIIAVFLTAINLIIATIFRDGVAPPIIFLHPSSPQASKTSQKFVFLRGYRIIFPCPSAVLAGFAGGVALWRPVITENFFLLLCRRGGDRRAARSGESGCDSPWQKNGESALNFARPCNRWPSLSCNGAIGGNAGDFSREGETCRVLGKISQSERS